MIFAQEIGQHDGALVIQHQQRIAGHGSAEDLVNADDFIFNEISEDGQNLVDREHLDFGRVQQHTVARELRE